jgi:SAM-dependent methyltransferase
VAALGKAPESVVDIGCGDGAFLRQFRDAGSMVLVGVDPNGPDEWSRGCGLHVRLDAGAEFDLGRRFDLAVCLEVAEHVQASSAPALVVNCVRHADRVIFSAATPGQGGTGHVNEQPMSYWDELFGQHGFARQDLFRHRLFHGISPWYRQNTFLYAKENRLIRIPNTKISMARYRDSFSDVQDELAVLRHDPFVPDVDGVFRPLIRGVYGSMPFGFHELANSAMVTKMRCQIASETMDWDIWNDCQYTIWIDADQIFRAQQAIDLVVATHENGWEIASGIYVTKSIPPRIVHLAPENPEDKLKAGWGPYARPYRVPGIGFGFVVTKNSVFRKLITVSKRTWFHDGCFAWDFFNTEVRESKDEFIDPVTGIRAPAFWSEDFSFCMRASDVGSDIWIMPNIVVGHRGRKDFGIRDMEAQK